MGALPGWESIQSTGWWSGFFFWASIVSLIGLGISEVASHRFSERRDELLEAQQQSEKKQHDEEMAQVRLQTAQANRDAEAAKREVAVAQAETAKANERTAELKLALEKEIAARQPRTITREQHDRIVNYLKDATPKGPITVVSKAFDEEAGKFGKQVISVLKDAGFEVTEGPGPLGFGERGAWIIVKDIDRFRTTPNAIGAVQAAFRDILQVEFDGGSRTDGFPDVDVTIAIGAKP